MGKPRFELVRTNREEYIRAWVWMYKNNKKKFDENPLYDDVNPMLNKKPLGTETANYCTVVYDTRVKVEGFKGRPVGIFCFVVTPAKIIGKQFVVDPDYMGKGFGKALLIENEKVLREKGYVQYYIGCSKCSAGILKKYWKLKPYSSDKEHDMYKFIVPLTRENFETLYTEIITNNSDIKVIQRKEG